MSHSSQRRPPVRNHTKDSVPNLINGVLHPKSVVAQLVQQGVTHYVTLPAGLLEAGDALRGLALGSGFPRVMFIGYRGHNRHGDTPDSAATFLEPYLHMWRVDYYIVESDDDLDRVPLAFDLAKKSNLPVAVAIGTEYAESEPATQGAARCSAMPMPVG